MIEAPRELALELFAGRLDEAWRSRAHRIQAVLTPILGAGGAASGALPDRRSRRASRLSRMRTPERDRAPAERVTEAFLAALTARDFEALAPLAGPRLWVLWPSGELLRHEKDPLFVALSVRAGAPSRAVPKNLRPYGDAELRGLVARGVPESIDALFELTNPIAVTAELASGSGPPARVLLMTAQDQAGHWRVHNFPLAGVDDALRASVAPSADEDEPVRVADRVVRHFLLGHEKQVRALRNQLMDQVWVDGALVAAEALSAAAGAGPHRLDQADTVFLGTKRADPAALKERAPLLQSLRRIAKEAWGRPLERLTTRIALSALATIDPVSQELRDRREAFTLLVRVDEQEGRAQRWRLAALSVRTSERLRVTTSV